MRRRWLMILPALALPGAAWAQAGLRPDPTPRLPPQSGQGLPVEDRRFLRDALALSRAQAAAADAAMRQGDDVGRLAGAVAERHQGLVRQMEALARRYGGVEAAGPEDARVAEALRLLAAPAEGGRGFLAAVMQVHPVIAELYQAEASQSTDRDLARVAITALAGMQEDFAQVIRLAAPLGLAPPQGTVANAPQYGARPPAR